MRRFIFKFNVLGTLKNEATITTDVKWNKLWTKEYEIQHCKLYRQSILENTTWETVCRECMIKRYMPCMKMSGRKH